MNLGIKLVTISIATIFIFQGCVTTGFDTGSKTPVQVESNKSTVISNVKEDSVFVQQENLAMAVWLLVKKIEKLEEGIAFAARSNNVNTQNVSNISASIANIQKQFEGLETKINLLSLDITAAKKQAIEEQNKTTLMPLVKNVEEKNISIAFPPDRVKIIENTNVREGAGSKFKIVRTAKKGEFFLSYPTDKKSWLKVDPNKELFIFKGNTKQVAYKETIIQPVPNGNVEHAVVGIENGVQCDSGLVSKFKILKENAMFKSKPSVNSKKIGTFKKGAEIKACFVNDAWLKLDRSIYYIHKSNLQSVDGNTSFKKSDDGK